MVEPEETHLGPRDRGVPGPISNSAVRPEIDRSVGTAPGRALVFELIPQVMHHKCVRAVLPNDVWRLLRKMTIEADGKRCGECASAQEMECHEVWRYLPPAAGDPGGRHVMKLVGLRTLCHLCHLGKHIGYALRNPALYRQVKGHLMDLYRLPEPVFSQLEQLAFAEVAELNKAGHRALDLTYLNVDRYIWIRHRFRRSFTTDEAAGCRQLSNVSDLGR
jgi:hypothetical protein